jgi:hypothetical protein
MASPPRSLSVRAGFVTPAAACWMYVGAIAEGMRKISYAGYRFPPEVIDQAIWLYLRFTLSFRDVEDLLAERGIAVSYQTVRRRSTGPVRNAVEERPVMAQLSRYAYLRILVHIASL